MVRKYSYVSSTLEPKIKADSLLKNPEKCDYTCNEMTVHGKPRLIKTVVLEHMEVPRNNLAGRAGSVT